MSIDEIKETKWNSVETGYESEETVFSIKRKYRGTEPDISIFMQSPSKFRGGSLVISTKSARKLIEALEYILK